MADSFTEKYGQWALVTGAAQGLGAEFCRQLAANGMSVVLVDIQQEKISALAEQLVSEFSVDTLAIRSDLAKEDFLQDIVSSLGDIRISLLVNNAGIASISKFDWQDEQQLLTQLNVNCRAALILTRHFSRPMIDRGKGAIIFVSSGAGDFSSAFNASYSATKAWSLKFAESLWCELKPFGIDVMAIQPVSTDTPAIHEQGIRQASLMSASQCVSETFQALGKYPGWVPGRANRIIHLVLTRFISKKTRIKLVSRELQRLFAKLR